MKELIDVQRLLKDFGTIIYTGNLSADLDLMEDEIIELYQTGLIDKEKYFKALMILKTRRNQTK